MANGHKAIMLKTYPTYPNLRNIGSFKGPSPLKPKIVCWVATINRIEIVMMIARKNNSNATMVQNPFLFLKITAKPSKNLLFE